VTALAEAAPPKVELPVLLGLTELVDIFPGVAKQTVYRWRTRDNLPPPLTVVSGTPMWDEETIVVWARERKLDLSRPALRKIRKAQGH
jgi:predicted DNA-binding transcriptional regulator AlpA